MNVQERDKYVSSMGLHVNVIMLTEEIAELGTKNFEWGVAAFSLAIGEK